MCSLDARKEDFHFSREATDGSLLLTAWPAWLCGALGARKKEVDEGNFLIKFFVFLSSELNGVFSLAVETRVYDSLSISKLDIDAFFTKSMMNGCFKAFAGFILLAGSQSRHRSIKSINLGSEHLVMEDRVLLPVLLFFPLELVIFLGLPYESKSIQMYKYNGKMICNQSYRKRFVIDFQQLVIL